MNQGDVTAQIESLDTGIGMYARVCKARVACLEKETEVLIREFRELIENEVAGEVLALTPHITSLYLSAEYHLACALFYASPGLWAVLVAIWTTIVVIYNCVKWIIDILHIKEILAVIDILTIISPQFRAHMNKIYGKISEVSAQVGWGVDGFGHLIQAAQSGLNVLGGVLGKDSGWMEIKLADRAIDTALLISSYMRTIQENPGYALDLIFKTQEHNLRREVFIWWQKASAWIEGAAATAAKAIAKVDATINSLQDLRNRMPDFVSENIPDAIWQGLDWADAQIGGTLLPAIARFDRAFSEVNAVLEAHRKKAESLIDQLTRPGDVLLGIDKLTEAGKLAQENIIDDVTSRKYERDVESDILDEAEEIGEFERIALALEAPLPPPVFLAIEDMPAHLVPGIVLEDRETWFVGDY